MVYKSTKLFFGLSVFTGIVVCLSLSFAATITLKSGKKIDGEIIEEEEKYIKVNFSGVKLTFWRDEIEKINRGEDQQALDYDFYFWAGLSLLKKGEYEQAIEKLNQAVSYAPLRAGAYHNLAVAYACKKDYPRAIEMFKKALERETGDYTEIISYNLATAYCYAGDIDRAKKIIAEIKNSYVATFLATIIAAKQAGANAVLSIAASSFPPDSVLLAPPPSSQAGKKRQDEIKELEKKLKNKIYVVENFPLLFFYHSPVSYLRLAMSYVEQKNWAKAEGYLRKARGLLADKHGYFNKVTLGGVYLFLGQVEMAKEKYVDAMEVLKEGVDLFPSWQPFYEHLGYVYYVLGDNDLAKENLEKALSMVAEDSQAASDIKDYLRQIEESDRASLDVMEIDDETEAESIRALVLRAERAYDRHDLLILMKCMAKNSPWVNGMEENLGREFSRFPYTRSYSKEIELKIFRSDQGLAAYLTTEFLFISFGNEGDIHSEGIKIYVLGKRKDGLGWRILQWRRAGGKEIEYYNEAMKHLSVREKEQAIEKLNVCLRINPNYSLAYLRLAEISLANEQMKEAIRYARKACDIRPDVAYYYYVLGLMYMADQQSSLAHEAFYKAKSLDTDFPGIDRYLSG